MFHLAEVSYCWSDRSILPVVASGSRAEGVEMCFKSSPLLPTFIKFKLQQNMTASPEEHAFVEMLLNLGNGTLTCSIA